LGSIGCLLEELDDVGLVREEALLLLGHFCETISPFAGLLAIRDESLALLVRVEPGVVVWLRVILCAAWICVWLVSDMTSAVDEGFRACAIASGPAHLGRSGTAILANTKLASTVTGSTFSLIFSGLAGSPNPKTIC
jgi:hypothetical protein